MLYLKNAEPLEPLKFHSLVTMMNVISVSIYTNIVTVKTSSQYEPK